MPYVRGIGYVKTGPRPRKRLAEIENHNAQLGTSSTGYSLRTRPDNSCLNCRHKWVPRGMNLSRKCPNCKKTTIYSSREAFEPQFPNEPKKPSFMDSFPALLLLIIPVISLIFLNRIIIDYNFPWDYLLTGLLGLTAFLLMKLSLINKAVLESQEVKNQAIGNGQAESSIINNTFWMLDKDSGIGSCFEIDEAE